MKPPRSFSSLLLFGLLSSAACDFNPFERGVPAFRKVEMKLSPDLQQAFQEETPSLLEEFSLLPSYSAAWDGLKISDIGIHASNPGTGQDFYNVTNIQQVTRTAAMVSFSTTLPVGAVRFQMALFQNSDGISNKYAPNDPDAYSVAMGNRKVITGVWYADQTISVPASGLPQFYFSAADALISQWAQDYRVRVCIGAAGVLPSNNVYAVHAIDGSLPTDCDAAFGVAGASNMTTNDFLQLEVGDAHYPYMIKQISPSYIIFEKLMVYPGNGLPESSPGIYPKIFMYSNDTYKTGRRIDVTHITPTAFAATDELWIYFSEL